MGVVLELEVLVSLTSITSCTSNYDSTVYSCTIITV